MAGNALPAVSPQAVREFLRQAAELGTWSARDAGRFLALGAGETKAALGVLETAGYVEKQGRDKWRNTGAGNAMAGVSSAAPVKRSTAAQKIEEFVERCGKVNKDAHYLFRVARAVVYGPYLVRGATIRNVDIAVELAAKEKNAAKHETAMKRRGEEAGQAGKRFGSFAAKRDWGRREVLDYLKSRSRAIDLVELTDSVLRQPHEDLL